MLSRLTSCLLPSSNPSRVVKPPKNRTPPFGQHGSPLGCPGSMFVSHCVVSLQLPAPKFQVDVHWASAKVVKTKSTTSTTIKLQVRGRTRSTRLLREKLSWEIPPN